ncbi:hypothetical protein QKU48_gp0220 [Fadolivirus algeromassiliense]|jgi:hypothetical protein|uniref:Uncharacterized protein n=1 Tax=Fadolivirus FV1/VV64 TaxID=3070911 RepID=A0A7D3R1B3_9VIRU|nr:hypothetical protein QKU48_gp0220 [Fadolivirus algeromassiliense]QKF93678.1 hypothetical protein Fadolivirus_1_220 [Fadolivirus FV1/VV64]
MKNLPICLLITIVAVLFLFMAVRENFSVSGMTISDDYCTKIADVYYKPKDNNGECRSNYRARICGRQRREGIDPRTGNYYTENGVLI